MFEGFDIWKLLAGLGIFMFGMFLMEESIKKLSGKAFKRLIRIYTTGKIKSILLPSNTGNFMFFLSLSDSFIGYY